MWLLLTYEDRQSHLAASTHAGFQDELASHGARAGAVALIAVWAPEILAKGLAVAGGLG